MLAGILPRVYPQMLAVVREHQDAGRPGLHRDRCLQPAAELLAQALVMDGAIGDPLGDRGRRLHRPPRRAFAYGEGKATRLREFAAASGST